MTGFQDVRFGLRLLGSGFIVRVKHGQSIHRLRQNLGFAFRLLGGAALQMKIGFVNNV
jgi:hypothetical protein